VARDHGDPCVHAVRDQQDLSYTDGSSRSRLRRCPSITAALADARLAGQPLGTRDLPTFFRRAAGTGWALVGDAAHHKDPFAARGIADALLGILSAWIAKVELRALCALARAVGGGRHGQIRDRLYAFYRWCADAQIPELTTLAETIETWWQAIEVFLTTGITNARTEGTNRLIKQLKRAACGFRNRDYYRRRVRLHCTRQTRRFSARNPTVPA
jgi:hypothetical protein